MAKNSYYWFDVRTHEPRGPYDAEQLRQLIGQGIVLPQSFLARAGDVDWRRAAEFPELADAFPVARRLALREQRSAATPDTAPPVDPRQIVRDNQSRLPPEVLDDLPHPLWNAGNARLVVAFSLLNLPLGLLLALIGLGAPLFLVLIIAGVVLNALLAWMLLVVFRP
ncbi:MAG: DUF4339 domain-containing protein [Verrucomicrobiota bacterium JB022]|nr:DUF4339 domain-containing protein [Verrucomicrobiota bacterium JB022]